MKDKLKGIIKDELKWALKESDEVMPGKVSHKVLGLKVARVVISGDSVKTHKDTILKILKKHDPEMKGDFYPATGKIVAVLVQVKLDFVRRDLKGLDPKISVEIKDQKLK